LLDFLQLIFPFLKLGNTNNLVTTVFFFVIASYFIKVMLHFMIKVHRRCILLKRLTIHIQTIRKPVQPKVLNELGDRFRRAYEKPFKPFLRRNNDFSEAWKDATISWQSDKPNCKDKFLGYRKHTALTYDPTNRYNSTTHQLCRY